MAGGKNMHERGMQIFEGDGLLTTPKNTSYKQGNAIISMKNACGERRLFKNPIAVAGARAGKRHSGSLPLTLRYPACRCATLCGHGREACLAVLIEKHENECAPARADQQSERTRWFGRSARIAARSLLNAAI
jgi:hypothetical protein